jgi:protein-L-isoaspartate(D-aspartate) O-methyltransferase
MQPLLERAKLMVKELGIKNVRFRHGDGSLGWKAHGPYDGILVAAAAHAVPQSLLEQLSPNGGRLVLPVGPDGAQELLRITRRDDHFVREKLGGVSFVPLVGGIG